MKESMALKALYADCVWYNKCFIEWMNAKQPTTGTISASLIVAAMDVKTAAEEVAKCV